MEKDNKTNQNLNKLSKNKTDKIQIHFTKKEAVCVYLDKNIINSIDDLGKILDLKKRSRSQIINKILESYLKQ